jgi:SAM-dependent methyltransferase
MPNSLPRLYDDLAAWWPLLSPPEDYEAEAPDLLQRLGVSPDARAGTMLELGAGGGSLAFHLKRHFDLTLTDRAPAMLAVSRAVNPECDHVAGDMRTLRLGREFDVVLVHDAIMYATEPADVQATLRTAAVHCRPRGTVVVLPDFDGTVTVAHDRHVEGLFPRAQWLAWFAEAGLPASRAMDPWGRDVFLGVRR